MLESGRKIKVLIAFGAITSFVLGFTTANTMQKTNWLGYFVYGAYVSPHYQERDYRIIPLNDNENSNKPASEDSGIMSPMVVDSIVIGLREDGVVVWKKAEDKMDTKK